MNRIHLKREIKFLIGFGLAVVVLGRIRFNIPGLMGVNSDFAEVALFSSLLFATNWVSAVLLSLFSVFNASTAANYIPTTLAHLIGMVFLYATYQRVRHISNMRVYAAALAGMLFVYYYVILVPGIFFIHFLLGNISLDKMLDLISEAIRPVVYEWATTTVVCVLIFMTHRESANRFAAQTEVLKINTELQAKIETLQKIAFVDAPTGLPNSLQLESDLADLSASAFMQERRYLMMGGFNIEGLTALTQEVGFERASKVYSSVTSSFADALTSMMNSKADYRLPDPIKLCYRIEASTVVFLMHLPNGIEDISELMKQDLLTKTIKNELNRQNIATPLSFRGAVTFYPEDTHSVEQLVHNVLNMLHSDGTPNRGDFVPFNPTQYKKYLRIEAIRQKMAAGIRDREFFMVFQPKVDVASSKLYGYEALARWQSADLGAVSPVEFISIAEKFHFIEELTKLLLKDVVQFIAQLQSQKQAFGRVAFNVSSDLLTPSFFTYLIEELGEGDLYKHLEIEITESMVPNMADHIVASFRQLKKVGITTAIDDFGTGYSNLVSLQSFEPDVLKIDKSFVDGIPGNPKSCKLVRAVLDIAKGLDMRVVAEGVETREQADFLLENGCLVMQGYLFSKPLNADMALAYSV
jgi:EAL domain-containing protein (putative c-di-GMP-specific phosphodiesterase class I)